MLDLKDIKGAIRQIVLDKGLPEEKIWQAIELAMAKAYKKEYLNRYAQVRATIDKDTGEVKFFRVFLVVDESMIIPAKSLEEQADQEDQNNLTSTSAKAQTKINKNIKPIDTPVNISSNQEDSTNSPETGWEAENEQDLENADIDEATKKIRFNPERHIMIDDAKKNNKNIKVGEELIIALKFEESFSRIAAQSAKQTIIQQIRELEKETTLNEFENKEGEIISGVIQKIDRGTVIVHLGKAIGILPAKEAIPFERFELEERKKFLILGIREAKDSLVVLLSRVHPQFIIKLLTLEVPEIQEGIVEIKAISREPGYRSKIAVWSNQPEVDAVGSCIGPKGVRINNVLEEIPNEKIDIVEYSEEPAIFVANALSPVKIKETEIDPVRREVKVFVNPELLSAVIGKNGQNVRLASKLTGWNIRVYSTVAPDFEQNTNTDSKTLSDNNIDGDIYNSSYDDDLDQKNNVDLTQNIDNNDNNDDPDDEYNDEYSNKEINDDEEQDEQITVTKKKSKRISKNNNDTMYTNDSEIKIKKED